MISKYFIHLKYIKHFVVNSRIENANNLLKLSWIMALLNIITKGTMVESTENHVSIAGKPRMSLQIF